MNYENVAKDNNFQISFDFKGAISTHSLLELLISKCHWVHLRNIKNVNIFPVMYKNSYGAKLSRKPCKRKLRYQAINFLKQSDIIPRDVTVLIKMNHFTPVPAALCFLYHFKTPITLILYL